MITVIYCSPTHLQFPNQKGCTKVSPTLQSKHYYLVSSEFALLSFEFNLLNSVS